ncbi:eCIS core domain-containing protein [Streptomyces sp. NPDC001770]
MGLAALQASAGNAAVVQMLREAGHSWTQEQHQHSADCGHRQTERPAVQRSATDATVARAEDEHAHPHDAGPERQSALLAAAMSSPSEALPSSVVAKAGAFYQNDALASTRVHHGVVAQRATEAMGAAAMTVGNHIFLSAGAAASEELIGHELSHVDKNLKGVPETGHNNGAGVAVTNPRQDSERAAERDGSAYAAGRETAPSLVASQTGAYAAAGPVQRMPEEEGRRIALQDGPQELSVEERIASLPEDSEQEVILQRGITPTQRKAMEKEVIRGSFISLSKMTAKPDEDATRPDPEHVRGYVNQERNDDVAKLIEFSTKSSIATGFAAEASFGIVLTIKIKRKFLAKGATGSESGWIARQGAPYDIVGIERKDQGVEKLAPLTEGEFREVVKKEEMAEFLLKVQDPAGKAQHMSSIEPSKKLAEAQKILAYSKAVYGA